MGRHAWHARYPLALASVPDAKWIRPPSRMRRSWAQPFRQKILVEAQPTYGVVLRSRFSKASF
jgi:hypothetical protein